MSGIARNTRRALGRLSAGSSPLIGRNVLVEMDRWELEERARALAAPVYVGDRVILCRVMGRYKFYVRSDDVGFGAHVALDGLWESWLTVFMARRIKPGMRVVDVGANHGYYTVLFADLAGPDGRVLAVEPNPRLTELLSRSLAVNGFSGWSDVAQIAAGDGDARRVMLYAPAGEPKNAHIVETDKGESEERFSVSCERLDDRLSAWDRVDFIKIDVEGAEEAAIRGLMTTLRRHRPNLLLEFNPGRCVDPAALLDALESIYGEIRVVGFDSEATPVGRGDLLNRDNAEDRILYLA
ncbi:FkbM family methyltransferase [Brevundimonas balnearis]|uniref:FkbM family methyltransferase n=1 Tax=Brevundimonas balnearis TaxID=1572858 RepID=A0ABV6R098_9CAUL